MRPKFALIRGEGEAAKSAELVIYDIIGYDPWGGGGISARAVTEALAGLSGVESIDVRLNSPGGEVADGTAIYNALARFPGRVVVHVDGVAASIATLIAMAGDEVRIAENAMWMIHQPWTVAAGDAPEMRRTAEVLDRHWSAMLTTYARRTGRRAETIANKVEKAGGEWWMTAEEAVTEGFGDVVAEPEKDVQAFGLERYSRVPERLAASAAPGTVARRAAFPSALEVAAPRVSRAPIRDPQEARRRAVAVLRLA